MQALLDVILPVFLLIAFGYLAVWQRWIGDAGIDGLMRFTQSFAIPCLLFSAISTLDLGVSFNIPLLLAFYAGATVSFILGIFGARIFFRREWTDCVAIGFVCLFSNSVLLGLAITERAYGAGALAGNYAIVALHAPFCYMMGVTAMEIARSGGSGVVTTSALMTPSSSVTRPSAWKIICLIRSGIPRLKVIPSRLPMMTAATLTIVPRGNIAPKLSHAMDNQGSMLVDNHWLPTAHLT